MLKAFCKPRVFLLNYLKAKLTFIRLNQASPLQLRFVMKHRFWTSNNALQCLHFVNILEAFQIFNFFTFICFSFFKTFANQVTSHLFLCPLQPASPSRTTAATNIQTLPHSQTPPKRLDTPTLEEPSDLEELEQFAKTFKQRRIKLGFTQVCSSEKICLINTGSVIFRFANVFFFWLWTPVSVFMCRFMEISPRSN